MLYPPRHTLLPTLAALALALPGSMARAADPAPGWTLAEPGTPIPGGHQHHHHDHSHHRAMLERKGYQRSTARYSLPAATLVDATSGPVDLRAFLDRPEPVLLQFIFTTCTTICPVLSATFAAAQDDLEALGRPFTLVSISIDPEHDTPAVLRDYAKRFEAGDDWHFLTGTQDTVTRVQKAFDAWYPGNNKMYHRPYTYLRAAPGQPWVRLDGMVSAAELVAEYRRLTAPLADR
jgi:protein SCO1/2